MRVVANAGRQTTSVSHYKRIAFGLFWRDFGESETSRLASSSDLFELGGKLAQWIVVIVIIYDISALNYVEYLLNENNSLQPGVPHSS